MLAQPAGVERCCAFPHPDGEQGPLAKMSDHDALWNQRLEELIKIAEANGGEANVSQTRGPTERAVLGRWCRKQARRSSPALHDS